MVEQPKRGDDVSAWRDFAHHLRARLGDAYADARAMEEARDAVAARDRARAHARAIEASAGARKAELRALTADYRRLQHAHREQGKRLDALARILLDEGDVPAALDILARRRAAIAAARGGRS